MIFIVEISVNPKEWYTCTPQNLTVDLKGLDGKSIAFDTIIFYNYVNSYSFRVIWVDATIIAA